MALLVSGGHTQLLAVDGVGEYRMLGESLDDAAIRVMQEKTGVNSALGISPTTADFVKDVAVSDMFEIESNKLAQDKGNASEKKFASQMVADHTKTSAELQGLVSRGKVKAELPTALDSSHQSKLDKLKGESGKDFSSDFQFA